MATQKPRKRPRPANGAPAGPSAQEPVPEPAQAQDGPHGANSGVREGRLADLTPDPRNANRGTERGAAMLEASLRQYGAGRAVVVDRRGVIIGGNKTVAAAGRAGLERVLVVPTVGDQLVVVQRTDLDLEADPRAAELGLADNRAQEVSLEWDPAVLQQLAASGIDLSRFWTTQELMLAMRGPDGGAVADPGAELDRAAELQDTWKTERGQFWELGNHRLLCGDATSATDVGRLMGGQRAALLWTDPPYGVEYVGKTGAALTLRNDGAAGLARMLADALQAISPALIPGAPFYIAHPPGPHSLVFGQAIIQAKWRLHQTLVWLKNTMVLGHTDYHYRHEPLFYGYTPGPGRPGRGDHEGTHWYGNHSETSVFEVDRPTRSENHPTMKPPDLIARCLANSSRHGEIVLDAFAGSGSTFVAAEQLGRRCYGMEIEPKYVAVTLERLKGLGLAPRLAAGP